MLRIGDIVQRTIVASCIGVSAWACVAAWQGHQARMHRAHDLWLKSQGLQPGTLPPPPSELKNTPIQNGNPT